MNYRRRVVVTGMGAITPLGLSVADSWSTAIAGKSGVDTISSFPVDDLPVTIAAQVKGFDLAQGISAKEARKVDMFIHYALEAAHQAFVDSGLTITDGNAHRCGAVIGSGIGGLPKIEENHSAILDNGPRRVSPFFIPGSIVNMIPGLLSMKLNLRGPNFSIATACATGGHNIGEAARLIRHNVADVIFAGGSEMTTDRLCISGFAAARALSKRCDQPTLASRPWDQDRDGFVLGEGAGVLVLEAYEHAVARGAHIYAELVGFGMSADAYHMTAPRSDGSGFALCIHNALSDAGINTDDIDYINAHGTSTPLGDEIETRAVKKVFKEHAYKLAVSSTKSMTGHTLGAAGAIESIFSILAINDQVAPPTINLDNPSPDCDLNYVPHQPQQRSIKYVLNNSFGFGGTNTSLIFAAM